MAFQERLGALQEDVKKIPIHILSHYLEGDVTDPISLLLNRSSQVGLPISHTTFCGGFCDVCLNLKSWLVGGKQSGLKKLRSDETG